MAAGDKAFWSDIADAIRPPCVRLIQQLSQSLTSGANAAITFGAGSEDIDTHNYHDTAANTSRITPLKAGRYRVVGTVNMAASTTITILTAFIGKNGVAVQPFLRTKPGAANTTCAVLVSAVVEMNGTTDYVELYGNQTTSGATAVSTQASGGVNSVLELEYIGTI